MRILTTFLAAMMLAGSCGCRCKSACITPDAPGAQPATQPARGAGQGGTGGGVSTEKTTVVFREGFESVALGAQPQSLRLYTTGRGGAIEVIRRYGILGNERCLKVTDAEAVEPGLWPGFSFAPNIAAGRATLAFDVRIDARTDLLVRWFGGAGARPVGPELRIAPGVVRVGKTVVASPPAGRWLHVEISAEVSPAPDRTWTLTVGPPGSRGRTFTGLAPADPQWSGLGEVGFFSTGKTAAVSLFDNVTLTLRGAGSPPKP